MEQRPPKRQGKMNFHQFFMGGDMGGMPGGHPGMRQQRREPVDTEKMYTILGVPKNCAQKDLRKAYLRKAQKMHPDKGGDADKFKELQKAYDILGNEEKRALYDEYGEEGVENGGGHDGADIMSQMFGGRGRQQRGPQKSPSSRHDFPVALEDLYKGKSTKLAVKSYTYSFDAHGQYQTNRGQRMSRTLDKKKVDLTIDRGMMEGQKIVLAGEGDCIPGAARGDTILSIVEKKHPVFTRQGCDLIMTKKINLFEALSGTTFTVNTLDGRKLMVKTKPGHCLTPGATMQVPEEGMPIFRQPFTKGCLFVKFEVEFPENLSINPDDSEKLSAILGQTCNESVVEEETDDMDVCELEDMDMDAARERERTRSSYEPEEEEQSGMGQNVQCQQS